MFSHDDILKIIFIPFTHRPIISSYFVIAPNIGRERERVLYVYGDVVIVVGCFVIVEKWRFDSH
jgi:hypothetical protein